MTYFARSREDDRIHLECRRNRENPAIGLPEGDKD
jgi:hypothetical protein